VGQQAKRPLGTLSKILQAQATRAGAALPLPPGLNPTGFVKGELDRDMKTANKPAGALRDGVQDMISRPSAPNVATTSIATTKVASQAPSSAVTMFTLELGTFHTESDAQDLARMLSDKGYSVEIIQEATADGGVVLRVHSGRFPDRLLAGQMQKTLETDVGLGATIVAVPHPAPG
jgi:cell division septation protein DedD